MWVESASNLDGHFIQEREDDTWFFGDPQCDGGVGHHQMLVFHL
jgi:hypothetical protein